MVPSVSVTRREVCQADGNSVLLQRVKPIAALPAVSIAIEGME